MKKLKRKIRKIPREEPIRRFIRGLVVDSKNRSYINDYIEKEIDEDMEILQEACSRYKRKPIELLTEVKKQISKLPNLAICQALPMVLGMKNIINLTMNTFTIKKLMRKRR